MKTYRLKNIEYFYDFCGAGEVHALRGVSIYINSGELVAVTGASGSGKTTLLKLLGGLLIPTAGSILIDEQVVRVRKEKDFERFRNKTIGYIQQDFGLVEEDTVFENVLLPLTISGVVGKKAETLVLNALHSVGVADLKRRKVKKLSGGQKQRVAIARAIVNNPDIILADEPTGNLDTATANEVINTLVKLNKEGKTVIVVTHNRDILSKFGRVIRLVDGVITHDSMMDIQRSEIVNVNDLRSKRRKEVRQGKYKRVVYAICIFLILMTVIFGYYRFKNRPNYYAGVNIAGVEVKMNNSSNFTYLLKEGKESNELAQFVTNLGWLATGLFWSDGASSYGSDYIEYRNDGSLNVLTRGGKWIASDGRMYAAYYNPTNFVMNWRFWVVINEIPQPFCVDDSDDEIMFFDVRLAPNSYTYIPVTPVRNKTFQRDTNRIGLLSLHQPLEVKRHFAWIDYAGRAVLRVHSDDFIPLADEFDVPILMAPEHTDIEPDFYTDYALAQPLTYAANVFSVNDGWIKLYLVLNNDKPSRELITHVLVDDEIIVLPNGKGFYRWVYEEGEMAVFEVEIDMSSLERGQHILFAHTILNSFDKLQPGDNFTPISTQSYIFTVD